MILSNKPVVSYPMGTVNGYPRPVAKRTPKVHRVEYRGYRGEATYDRESGLLYGSVVNLPRGDAVCIRGATPGDLRADLAGAIDFYEETLSKYGRTPAPVMLPGPTPGARD
jgi:hypothetical protein